MQWSGTCPKKIVTSVGEIANSPEGNCGYCTGKRIRMVSSFLVKGQFQADTLKDMDNIAGELFDRHIARETDFSIWKSMLETANKEYESDK